MADFAILTCNYKKWAEEMQEKGLDYKPADEYIVWLNIVFNEARQELAIYRRIYDSVCDAQLEGTEKLSQFGADMRKKSDEDRVANVLTWLGR